MCRPDRTGRWSSSSGTLRQETGLTYAELADRLKEQDIVLSASRLSKFLNGHEMPSRSRSLPCTACATTPWHAPAPDALRATQQLLYAVLTRTG